MKCTQPVPVFPRNKKIMVPCGKCLSCLSNKRVDWAFRLMQEYKVSRSAYFVTLTYDRKNLAKADYQLSKRDVQLYLKRLRKNDSSNRIRYYAVGEYGSDTQRPHYHILLFNTSELHVRKSWQKGIVHVGSVTEASVSYCLKYIVQPELALKGKQKPFSLMSRGYGIGAHYLDDAIIAWHRSGDKNYTVIQGRQGRLPRFYKDKIWPQQYYLNPDGEKIPLEEDQFTDRERVRLKSKAYGMKKERAQLRWFWEQYGPEGPAKLKEFRNAELSRLKLKVAFTQTL